MRGSCLLLAGLALGACSLTSLDDLQGGSAGAGPEGGNGGSGGTGSDGGGAAGTAGWAGSAGSSGSAGLAGGGNYSCQTMCDNVVSANCANETMVGCLNECESDISEIIAECPTEISAFLACMSTADISCNTGGEADIVKACGVQGFAVSECAACVPSSSDDACETCSKSSCCDERQALYGQADLGAFVECVNACVGETACAQGCSSQYPSVAQAFQAMLTCEQSCAACGA